MMQQSQVKEILQSLKILPLYYHNDAETCLHIMHALKAAGIAMIEFTNRGTEAMDNFKILAAENRQSAKPLLLSVGTVQNEEQANAFIDAGADVIISPFYSEEVNKACNAQNKVYIPGCMTPTEIHNALKAGCTMIKIFPGNVVGPGFLQAIKPLFTDAQFIVTGGVLADTKNIKNWYAAGAHAVGLGSQLISPTLLLTKDWALLTANCINLLQELGAD